MSTNHNSAATGENEVSEVEQSRTWTRVFLTQRFWFVFIFCVAILLGKIAFPAVESGRRRLVKNSIEYKEATSMLCKSKCFDLINALKTDAGRISYNGLSCVWYRHYWFFWSYGQGFINSKTKNHDSKVLGKDDVRVGLYQDQGVLHFYRDSSQNPGDWKLQIGEWTAETFLFWDLSRTKDGPYNEMLVCGILRDGSYIFKGKLNEQLAEFLAQIKTFPSKKK